jgi:5-methylcytosine-specific restriction protein A
MANRKPWQHTGPDKRLRGRAGQVQRQCRLDRTDGLCEHCLKVDRVTLATVVNHIIPLARGGEDTDENTENLCGPCDEIATAKQFAKAPPVKGRGIGRDGRPTSRDHPWNGPKRT